MSSQTLTSHSGAARTARLPGNVPEDCHAKIRQMVEYWLSIHPDNELPGRQHFNPADIPQLLSNLRLLDVVGDPPRFKTRLMGTRLREFFGAEHTGRWYEDMFPHFRQSATYPGLLKVVQTQQPDWRRGKPTLLYEKDFLTLERVFLPFATDGQTVDMVVTLMLFGDDQGRFF